MRVRWLVRNGSATVRTAWALTAEREECAVEVSLLRRFDNLEIEMQRRCCNSCALDSDDAKRVRRVRQHRDPPEGREQLFQQLDAFTFEIGG